MWLFHRNTIPLFQEQFGVGVMLDRENEAHLLPFLFFSGFRKENSSLCLYMGMSCVRHPSLQSACSLTTQVGEAV